MDERNPDMFNSRGSNGKRAFSLSWGPGQVPYEVATSVKQRTTLVASRRKVRLLGHIQTGRSELWVAELRCRWVLPGSSQLSPRGKALGWQPGSAIWDIAFAHKPIKLAQ